MKVYKLELMVIDHDEIGPEEMQTILENMRYPNHCMSPHVMNVKSADIGEWDDNNPLNRKDTMQKEFERLFPLT